MVLLLLQSEQGSSVGKSSAKRKGGQSKKKSSVHSAEDHDDIDDDGDNTGGAGGCDGGERESESEEEEFVAEISGVVDWCTRVVVPALSENFVKGLAPVIKIMYVGESRTRQMYKIHDLCPCDNISHLNCFCIIYSELYIDNFCGVKSILSLMKSRPDAQYIAEHCISTIVVFNKYFFNDVCVPQTTVLQTMGN